MWVNINGDNYNIIGDPHLGKEFRNGVPLDRRGEREANQYRQFWSELHSGSLTMTTIIIGDLLDRFTVNDNIKMRVYTSLRSAAKTKPNSMFYVMMGNHDGSRDTEEQSSFNVLQAMCAEFENIVFVTKPYQTGGEHSTILLIPYDEFVPTCDMQFTGPSMDMDKYDAVFTHNDLMSIGNDHNLLPIIKLGKITDRIFNGHVHTPEILLYDKSGKLMDRGQTIMDIDDGVETTTVWNVGSMQPYSHGEDPNEQIYVTRTLEQFLDAPTIYHDKVLRLKLKKGQDVPVIDALQWSVQWEESSDQSDTEVKMEEFSFEQLFKETMASKGLAQTVVDEWWTKFVKGNGNDLNS